MRDVHTSLAAWMARVGMTVRVDAIGNIRGVYPPLVIACACRRDAALLHRVASRHSAERRRIRWCAWDRACHRAGRAARRANGFHLRLRSSDFLTRKACGSALHFWAAARSPAHSTPALLDRLDERGRSLRDAIRHFGLDPNRIPDAQAPANALGYLEFHIEQGPVLENLNLPLAVVDVISGQSRADLMFEGVAGHAGTTPMKIRKDALAGAAAWIAEVEREALTTPGLVATVGKNRGRAGRRQRRARPRGCVAGRASSRRCACVRRLWSG